MIKSMTGFGTVSLDTPHFSLMVEVKSLNSKTLDVFVKMGSQFSDKEIDLRNLLGKVLERGKINLLIAYSNKRETEGRMVVNRPLVAQYYRDLRETAEMLGAPQQDLLRMAMLMPEAYTQAAPTRANEEDWQVVQQAVQEAIAACDVFRAKEGEALAQMLKECAQTIGALLAQVEERDPERVEQVRNRLREHVRELEGNENFDSNRFEQELIFYIEKLDINEEKVRLRSHLAYFAETLEEKNSNGKKLGFIAQEIGREINTIGSKANDAAMQRLVVGMKEELEKIKEQINNVL